MQDDKRVNEHELERMAVAACIGDELIPTTPAARELFEKMKRNAARIKAKGGSIDISFD